MFRELFNLVFVGNAASIKLLNEWFHVFGISVFLCRVKKENPSFAAAASLYHVRHLSVKYVYPFLSRLSTNHSMPLLGMFLVLVTRQVITHIILAGTCHDSVCIDFQSIVYGGCAPFAAPQGHHRSILPFCQHPVYQGLSTLFRVGTLVFVPIVTHTTGPAVGYEEQVIGTMPK